MPICVTLKVQLTAKEAFELQSRALAVSVNVEDYVRQKLGLDKLPEAPQRKLGRPPLPPAERAKREAVRFALKSWTSFCARPHYDFRKKAEWAAKKFLLETYAETGELHVDLLADVVDLAKSCLIGGADPAKYPAVPKTWFSRLRKVVHVCQCESHGQRPET